MRDPTGNTAIANIIAEERVARGLSPLPAKKPHIGPRRYSTAFTPSAGEIARFLAMIERL